MIPLLLSFSPIGGEDTMNWSVWPLPGQQRDRLVARVAAAFALFLQEVIKPDQFAASRTEAEFEEEFYLTDVELGDIFQEFCNLSSSEGAGFDGVLQWLVGWRVLIETLSCDGVHRFLVSELLNGKKPPQDVHFVNPLPPYKLDRKMVLAVGEGQGISMSRKDRQHALLFAEEVEKIWEVCRNKFKVKKPWPAYWDKKSQRRLHKIRVPAFHGQSVMRGNSVYVRSRRYPQHRGFIHEVCPDSAVLASFHPTFHNTPSFSVRFGRAADDSEKFMAQLESTKHMIRPTAADDPELNLEQNLFLSASLLPLLLCGPPGSETLLPLLLWGPPRTGKTTTLVRTIWTLITKDPTAKVLVSAPSNPAANLLCERLSELGIQPDRCLVTNQSVPLRVAAHRFTRMRINVILSWVAFGCVRNKRSRW